jgi:transcriptional regulator with XRE-family HTH domain
MNNSAKKLGENIRRIREEKQMMQIDLCRKLNVDGAYISNIENGKSNPTLLTIERIAKALEVSVEDLMK